MTFNPFAREIKFAQAVNNAVMYKVSFQIFRSVEGKVQKFNIRMLHCNLQGDLAGILQVEYSRNDEIVVEIATEQDLMLISQRARQLESVRK